VNAVEFYLKLYAAALIAIGPIASYDPPEVRAKLLADRAFKLLTGSDVPPDLMRVNVDADLVTDKQ
jgi:hypothetical protein